MLAGTIVAAAFVVAGLFVARQVAQLTVIISVALLFIALVWRMQLARWLLPLVVAGCAVMHQRGMVRGVVAERQAADAQMGVRLCCASQRRRIKATLI